MMKPRNIVEFGTLALILYGGSLLVVAGIWTVIAPERFNHCWDDAPLVTFIPPFVHPWANTTDGMGGVLRDY